jgi:hypothetical protein
VRGLDFTPLTKLVEFNFTLDELLVFARPIVDTLTLRAGEADELFLGHNGETIPDLRRRRKRVLGVTQLAVPVGKAAVGQVFHEGIHQKPC